MPVETMVCSECNGKGYMRKRRIACPKCGGLGVVKTEIPDFVPERLKRFVMV